MSRPFLRIRFDLPFGNKVQMSTCLFYILHFVCSTAFSAISDRSLVLANSRKVLVETAESYMPVCGVALSFLSHWFSYQVNSISAKVVTNPAFS